MRHTVIHYTTDGSTPTAASPIYMGPITLNADEVILVGGDTSGT